MNLQKLFPPTKFSLFFFINGPVYLSSANSSDQAAQHFHCPIAIFSDSDEAQ